MADPFEDLRAALAGRYAVERELGRGGMATVYLARDERYDREVAIKVLLPDLSASIGADRFQREIRVAAQLQHPNILGLYESGSDNGLLFYVMPFVKGESLRDRLDREKQLPIDDAIHLAREIAEALQYAHDQGVIHRDIKPENILLQGGHALVADFGIARAVATAADEKLTKTGMAVGTPHYMSPEQSLGGEVDGRSDIYSLGCVLYEMLIGQPPFDGRNASALIARHAMEAVPSLQIARATVPDDLENIVMMALNKTAADRFQSCRDFADALTEVDHELITRRTTSRAIPRRTGTFATPAAPEPAAPARNRFLVPGIAAGVVLLGAAAALMFSKRTAAPPATGDVTKAKQLAVMYFEDASKTKDLGYLADGLTEDLIRELATVRGLTVISRNGVAPYRGAAVTPDSIGRALDVGTLVSGAVETGTSGNVRVSVQLVDAASGAAFSRFSFEQPAGNGLAIRDSLTQQVSRLLRQRLGEEYGVRAQLAGTRSPEAWAVVQRAEQQRKSVEADTSAAAERGYDQVDSLLVLASQQDAKWPAPIVLRAAVAYRRSRIHGGEPPESRRWAERAVELANQALTVEPNDADALEVRGNARYWMYIRTQLVSDEKRRQELLTGARADLERSTELSPTQAGAWYSLSHVYNQFDDVSSTQALIAAQKAYEADAYLANANLVLERLFLSAYDLDEGALAQRSCADGARRFPADPRFRGCQIWLMTMRTQQADPARAWKLIDGGNFIVSGRGSDQFQQRRAQLGVAGVLARAGLADSARSVATRAANVGKDVDPDNELAFIKAFVLTLSGDRSGAIRDLGTFLVAHPDRRAGLRNDPGWWFRDLSSEPTWKQLVAGGKAS